MVWIVLVVAANVLRLLLIDAGTRLHFEHLRAASALSRGEVAVADWIGIAAFGVLGVVVWSQLRAELPHALRAMRHRMGVSGTVAVLAVLVGTVALPSAHPVEFGTDVVVAMVFRLTLIGLTWLAVRDLPDGWSDRIRRLWHDVLEHDTTSLAPWVRQLPFWCAAFSVIASGLLAYFAYERVPHIPDEVAYLFQARYFATGALTAPAPPVPAGFEVFLITCESGRCLSPFPPGWPAFLAVGVLLHAAWLVNPVLGACNVLLTFAFARELWGLRVARLAALLLSVSPWHLLMSMSFMSHTSSLLVALVAAYAVARAHRTGRSVYCVLGGVAIGWSSLSRPLEAMVLVAILGTAALFIRGTRWRLAPVIVLGACTAMVAALNAVYNQRLTGDVRVFPVTQYMDAAFGKGMNDLGFGANRNIRLDGLDPFPGHGLRDVIVNTQIGLSQLQTELFGWGVGSLWLALLLVVTRRARGHDHWLLAWIATVIALQSLYWYSGGPDFGARYWYTVIVPLVILSARGLLELEADAPAATSRLPWITSSALMAIAAITLFVPWRAIDKYHGFRTLQHGMRDLLASRDFGRSVLLVRGNERPDYASALNFTPIDPNADAPLIYWAKDDATEVALREAYADRPVFIVEGPSRTGDSYRVVESSMPRPPAR